MHSRIEKLRNAQTRLREIWNHISMNYIIYYPKYKNENKIPNNVQLKLNIQTELFKQLKPLILHIHQAYYIQNCDIKAINKVQKLFISHMKRTNTIDKVGANNVLFTSQVPSAIKLAPFTLYDATVRGTSDQLKHVIRILEEIPKYTKQRSDAGIKMTLIHQQLVDQMNTKPNFIKQSDKREKYEGKSPSDFFNYIKRNWIHHTNVLFSEKINEIKLYKNKLSPPKGDKKDNKKGINQIDKNW